MNLAQVIHQRWAAAETLNNLLPAASVYTGMGVDPTVPYAVIGKRSDRPAAYHNDGSALSTVCLRIELFHDNHDSAAAVRDQIMAAFDRTDFALSGSDKVINMQRSDDFEVQEEAGTWRFVIDFNCTVYLG